MSKFISPQKAADMLGVSTNTLRNWSESGRLVPHKTIGGHRRYYKKDIEDMLNNIVQSQPEKK